MKIVSYLYLAFQFFPNLEYNAYQVHLGIEEKLVNFECFNQAHLVNEGKLGGTNVDQAHSVIKGSLQRCSIN